MTTGVRMTVHDYLALPEAKPYREYVCGEVIEKSMPNEEHGILVQEIAACFARWMHLAGGKAGPEIRVRFDTERGPEYRLPDYSYWSSGRPRRDGKDSLPPTLAVEVKSPDEPLEQLRSKCRYMRRYGVDVCWLIDPGRRVVEVFETERDGQPVAVGALRSKALGDLEIDVPALFAALDD
ncbi:MAG: Uma2 family endonuclease [Dehalococcoidia bacterium]|nr:Uma2 family endonuclease [Dehalococcoidia bacterium]